MSRNESFAVMFAGMALLAGLADLLMHFRLWGGAIVCLVGAFCWGYYAAGLERP